MSMNPTGRPAVATLDGWMRNVERQVLSGARRPTPVDLSDAVGPGISGRAVQLFDWNVLEATYNGYFWSDAQAFHSPDPDVVWTGQVIARDNGGGLQQVWNPDAPDEATFWIRTWSTDEATGAITFTEWRHFATPSGYLSPDILDPDFVAGVTSDGVVPGTGPAVDVEGGISYLYARWDAVDLNLDGDPQNDVVTYWVYAGLPGAEEFVTSIGGLSTVIRKIPGDTNPLQPLTDYSVYVVASDADGFGAPGPASIGQLEQVDTPDIRATAAWVGTMTADHLRGGDLNYDVIVASGSMEARGTGIVGLSGEEGFYVKGPLPPSGKESERDLLVTFPVNGDPNIIAGQLTATTALFTKGATFQGTSGIDVGAKLILFGDIKAPKNPPTAANTWDEDTLATAGGGIIRAITRGHDGGIYALGDTNTLRRWAMTGSSPFAIDSTPIVISGLPSGASVDQIVYNPIRSAYNITYTTSGGSKKHWIAALTTAFAYVAASAFERDLDYAITNPFDPGGGRPVPNVLASWRIGVNYTTGQVLEVHNATNNTWKIVTWTTTSAGAVVAGTSTTITPSVDIVDFVDTPFVGMGDFDYGAGTNKIILHRTASFLAYSATGTRQSQWDWSQAAAVENAWYDPTSTRFRSARIMADGSLRRYTYESGETNHGGVNKEWWIGESLYDSVGTVHETPLTPLTHITMKQRAKLLVTMDPTPGTGSADEPTNRRVWMGKNASTTAGPATSALFLRATLANSTGLNSVTIVPGTDGAAFSTAKAADFPASLSPGGIESNSGGSYWYGDDTAKFLQLQLDSNTDATNTAGNKPALRIGPPSGAHQRIDGNEVIAMTSDTVQGTYRINQNGGTIVGLGPPIFGFDFDRNVAKTTDANSEFTLGHNMGTGNLAIFLTPRTTNRHLTVTGISATQITVQVRLLTTGALSGAGSTLNVDFFVVKMT